MFIFDIEDYHCANATFQVDTINPATRPEQMWAAGCFFFLKTGFWFPPEVQG